MELRIPWATLFACMLGVKSEKDRRKSSQTELRKLGQMPSMRKESEQAVERPSIYNVVDELQTCRGWSVMEDRRKPETQSGGRCTDVAATERPNRNNGSEGTVGSSKFLINF
eukprot:Gb_36363 [translate_table: standard]